MMTTVLFVRHGESYANKKELFAGHLDVELEKKGVQQAELTGDYIAENYNVDALYASDLIRAYETGKIIAEKVGKPITEDKRFREINAGLWEGVAYEELKEMFRKEFWVWKNDIGKAVCTGGETVKELGERVMKAATELAAKNDGKTIVIATHATPIRAMECIARTGDVLDMKKISWVSNASVSVFTYENKKWCVKETNINEHLKNINTELPVNV